MNQPSVYIILLNWNGWRDTVRCVDSLAQMLYSNYTIVIVDNASSNDSVSHLKEYCSTALIVESRENLGFAGGCNLGIRTALELGADYVWLLNNDTVVDSMALEHLVTVAQTESNVGAVGGVLYDMHSTTVQAWGGGRVNPCTGLTRNFHGPVGWHLIDYIHGACVLFPRKVLQEHGLLDSDAFFMYWEDTEIGFRLRKEGMRLCVAERAKVWHKESSSVGVGSPLKDFLFTMSSVRFLKEYSSCPIISISISVLGRMLKRLFARKWANLTAVYQGGLRGVISLREVR